MADDDNKLDDVNVSEGNSNQPRTLDEWLAQHRDLDPNYVASLRLRVDTVGFNLDDINQNYAEYQERQAREQANQPAPETSQNAEQPEKSFSDEEYAAAVALANADLEKQSFDETLAAWTVLSSVDEVIAQKTHPDRAAAKNKLKDFAEQKVAAASQKDAEGNDLPLSMENAPELSSWLAISNDVQANNNSQEKKDRNAALGARLDAFYKKFDEENGLTNLPDAKTVEKNSIELDAMEKDFDPFAKDEKGNLVHPEFAGVASFYDNLEIDNSDKDTDKLDKNSYRDDMKTLAIAEAQQNLLIDPEFNKLSPEDKKKRFISEVASQMEQGATHLIATQMAMNAAEKAADGKPRDPKEFEQNAHKYFEAASNEGALPIKIKNNAAMGVLSSRVTDLSHKAKRVAQKTGAMNVWNKVKTLDKSLTKKYPKAYPFMKNFAITTGIGMATGGAGLAVYSAYKAGKAIQQSYKNYKENRQEGQSYWNYLKKNPKQMIALSASVAGAALSAYGVGDFTDAASYGLAGNVAENALSGGAAAVATDAAAQAATETAKSSGGVRLAKGFVALGAGLGTGAVDAIKALREKDPEKRKQKLKDAWKASAGAVAGAVVGMFAGKTLGDVFSGHDDTPPAPAEAPTIDQINPEALEDPKIEVEPTTPAPAEAPTIDQINPEALEDPKIELEPTIPAPAEAEPVASDDGKVEVQPTLDDLKGEQAHHGDVEGQHASDNVPPVSQHDDNLSIHTDKMPSHEQMFRLAEGLKERYGETGQFGVALNAELQEAVRNGEMTQEQALTAVQIVTETVEGHHGDYDKAINDIYMNADAEASAERNASIAAEQAAWEQQHSSATTEEASLSDKDKLDMLRQGKAVAAENTSKPSVTPTKVDINNVTRGGGHDIA